MINIFLKTAPEIDKELAERLAGREEKYRRRNWRQGQESALAL